MGSKVYDVSVKLAENIFLGDLAHALIMRLEIIVNILLLYFII